MLTWCSAAFAMNWLLFILMKDRDGLTFSLMHPFLLDMYTLDFLILGSLTEISGLYFWLCVCVHTVYCFALGYVVYCCIILELLLGFKMSLFSELSMVKGMGA